MLAGPKRIALSLALSVLAFAPSAQADDWGITFGKRTKYGNIGITVGSRGHVSSRGHVGSRGHVHPKYRRQQYHCHSSACERGGRYQTRYDKVWVPGSERRVWVPARYDGYVDACGVYRQRVISPGHYEYVHEPGYFDTRAVKVWVPGRRICGY